MQAALPHRAPVIGASDAPPSPPGEPCRAATYAYDLWGGHKSVSEPGLGGWAQPFLFAGTTYDRETGLYYNRARYYNPQLGRFISQDPIGLAGGINLYAYAGNAPVRESHVRRARR